ncbi:MAG: sulfotransferase [Candidatus Thiodiazotropha sp. (ex Dulcina madagascariensis)]|nr:sulfotransferase [Candidatus Thiodiazotropha sp. (ex Epidulcina cf. delphinae)]MCU7935668.1 sulfotransferase [Candidatus Thiodiazotropha sp. (ex Dulcina madagascariensis)]
MQPIFMIGMQRSGSNLLRLMLNQLSEIVSPHPPHILHRICPLQERYGDLSDERNFNLLTDDVCRLVELNPVPWEKVVLDRDDVKSRCRENSLVALLGAVYDICAEVQQAQTWCCKSLANIRYVDEIERYYDAPKYIFLYRDGRDVALSFRKAVVGEKHFYNIAKGWMHVQETGLALRDKIGPKRLCSVSYEELTGEPEETAKRLCEFLGVDYAEGMLEFHRSDEAKRAAGSSDLWGKLTQPVMKNNTRKFLREASEHDIRIFESVAGDVLERLGYDRVYVPSGEELALSDLEIEAFNEENERLKQELMSRVDKEDLERRDRQAGLLSEIKSRPRA